MSQSTLSIDIGGSHLKCAVLGEDGQMLTGRMKCDTPERAEPLAVLDALDSLTADLGPFDRVAVGFPGVIRRGVVIAAPNLDRSWEGYELQAELQRRWGKPVRLANDADMQGAAVVSGEGVEMVVTLGTGVGTAIFVDGRAVPNLEVGHAPFRKGESFEEQLGKATCRRIGDEKWNARLEKAIAVWRLVFNFDRLYIGGGLAKRVSLDLPDDVTLVSNKAGVLGGIRLWDPQANLDRSSLE